MTTLTKATRGAGHQWLADLLADPDREGCAEWPFYRDPHGYGRVTSQLAHRRVWELAHGPIPVGLCVLHRCDNPPCVNPAHLFLGTIQDNNADMIAKGRKARLIGTGHPRAKLTEVDVMAIRSDDRPQRVIADDYGICHATVSYIKTGQRWGHL